VKGTQARPWRSTPSATAHGLLAMNSIRRRQKHMTGVDVTLAELHVLAAGVREGMIRAAAVDLDGWWLDPGAGPT
jgi:hypothetical protein